MKCKLTEAELRSSRQLQSTARERLATLDSLATRIRQGGLTMKISYSERQYFHVPLAVFYHDGHQVAQWWPASGRGTLGHPAVGKLTKFETKRAGKAVALAIGAIPKQRAAKAS